MEKTKICFSNILSKLMKSKKITFKFLSQQTGIPQSTLKDYAYKDGTHPRNMNHLRSLSKVFGVSIEHLLWGENDDELQELENSNKTKLIEGWVKLSIEIPESNKAQLEILKSLIILKGKK